MARAPSPGDVSGHPLVKVNDAVIISQSLK